MNHTLRLQIPKTLYEPLVKVAHITAVPQIRPHLTLLVG